jgi:putative peptide-modifying radical SAM enzyme
MEYYIYTTKRCNLHCNYCDGIGLNSSNECNNYDAIDAKPILDFILADVPPDNTKYIVFYGGEPLLNQKFIRSFLELSSGYGLNYILHTNGLLLNEEISDILSELDVIFVSIDGEKELHDSNRGQGTFDTIIKNIEKIKQRFELDYVARMTLTLQASVFKAVMGVISYFDHIFWQVENSPHYLSNIGPFRERYEHEIDRLVEYWVWNLEHGLALNLIPFQAIASSLLYGQKQTSLRCGASGDNLCYIDTDGLCYVCDKLIGKRDFCIGSIYNGISHEKKFLHTELKEECKKCDIKYICGGGCLAQLLCYPFEKFNFYCHLRRTTITKIREKLPRLKTLLENGIIQDLAVNNVLATLTEQL